MNNLLTRSRQLLLVTTLLLTGFLGPATAVAVINVQIQTDQGNIDIELFNEAAPLTVRNFLKYFCDGDYQGTFIHRSDPGFVLQMGGYIFEPANGDFVSTGTSHIPTDPPVVNEPDPVNRSNLRGTIAMAKLGGDPDSATSEWFVNLADNSANLDVQNDGFTVFGRVTSGMNVVDAIAALPRCQDIQIGLPALCGGFADTPVVNLTMGDNVQLANLVTLNNDSSDSDSDGICDVIEDNAPGGDGNDDGTPDRIQGHVTSFLDRNGAYLSLATDPGLQIGAIAVYGQEFLLFKPTISAMGGHNFSHGFIGFEVSNVVPGGMVQVDMILPAGENPVGYFMYGGTPTDAIPHWYDFAFDGLSGTGAQFAGNIITLSYVDGGRGDADLDDTNGVIVDPGAPGLPAAIAGPSGGGCSLHGSSAAPERAGAWWLLLSLLLLYRPVRKRLINP